MDQRIKEAEGILAPLEERKNVLNEQIETLETKLAEKGELLEHIGELGKLGFDIDRLRHLREALTEIGAKHGLKGKEAVSKFFDDLKDYEAVLGAESLLKGLQTQIETKKLEAENWQAKEEALRRKHDDLKEAIGAVHALFQCGVKAEEIVSWNKIVSAVGGPGELENELANYESIQELLNTRKKEIDGCELEVAGLKGQVNGLKEQKTNIEGAIKSLSNSGVKEIAKVSDKAITGLTSLLDETRAETGRLASLKAEAGKLEKELMYARYFTTTDETVLKAFPKEVVIVFLDRAGTWCRLNNLNPMLKISASSERTLVDLIAWAEAVLGGLSQ